MTLTTHAIVGASIASLFPEHPILAFGLAFASHYVSDMIPHTELFPEHFIIEKSDTNATESAAKKLKLAFHDARSSLGFLLIGIDFVAAIILCLLIFVRDEQSLLIVAIGFLGGVLPDFLQFVYYKCRKMPWTIFQKIHDFFHSKKKMQDRPIIGSIAQVAECVVFVGLYFWLR